MKTIATIFIKDNWNKDFRKILTYLPIKFFLLFGLFLLFSGTEKLYSQSNSQLSNSVNQERIGDDCSEFICGEYDDKLLICHVPPGNPENEHEICISSNAIQTHLTHGDYCGPCTLLSNPTPENTPSISIYPNPFTNTIFVELKEELLTNNENVEIIIYDLLGRTIKSGTLINTTTFELDLSNLKSGLYLYNISKSNEIVGKGKIIKK